MIIFNSYVCLPEGKNHVGKTRKTYKTPDGNLARNIAIRPRNKAFDDLPFLKMIMDAIFAFACAYLRVRFLGWMRTYWDNSGIFWVVPIV